MNTGLEVPQRRRRRVVLRYVFRGIYSALFVVINYFLFFILPNTVLEYAGQLAPDLGETVMAYFVAIEVLTVTRIMLKDHVIGTISAASLGLVQAVYIYTITNGGTLTTTLSGLSVTIEFKTIVYLMMAIPLLGIVKQVLERIHKSSTQPVTMIEVVG